MGVGGGVQIYLNSNKGVQEEFKVGNCCAMLLDYKMKIKNRSKMQYQSSVDDLQL